MKKKETFSTKVVNEGQPPKRKNNESHLLTKKHRTNNWKSDRYDQTSPVTACLNLVAMMLDAMSGNSGADCR